MKIALLFSLVLFGCSSGSDAAPTAAPVAAPGDPLAAAPAAGPTPPASFGIPECDHYAAVVCNCSNESMRVPLCQAAHQQFAAWAQAITQGEPARAAAARGCVATEEGLVAAQCPGTTVGAVTTIEPEAPEAPAPTAPTLGITECDRYAAVACACSSTTMRAGLCDAVRGQFETWRGVIASTPAARDAITTACADQERALLGGPCTGTTVSVAPPAAPAPAAPTAAEPAPPTAAAEPAAPAAEPTPAPARRRGPRGWRACECCYVAFDSECAATDFPAGRDAACTACPRGDMVHCARCFESGATVDQCETPCGLD